MKNNRRIILIFIILSALLVFLFAVNINCGSTGISATEVFDIIFRGKGSMTERKIVLAIRLPRILAAAVLGGALAVSGYLLQTFFSNPIAGPFVLGISSGAKLVVSLVMILFTEVGIIISSFSLIAAAFVGSLVATGFILLLSRRLPKMSMLIVGGVMVGYICSAVTDFVITFADDSNIVNLHNWAMGSFSGIDMDNVAVISAFVAVALLFCIFLLKPIRACQLGEVYAKSVGVNTRLFRTALIVVSSLLSACVTAFAGPVSFVGIAVPHLAGKMLNTSKPHAVLPCCFIGGAVFCLFCDLVARTVFAPVELSISTVTAIFGAPVVIVMMIKRNGVR